MNEKGKNIVLLIIGILVLLISIFPLLRDGYIRTHDLNLYPIWLFEFDKGIKDGMFLPRWSQDFWLGYGAPLFNFIQPLFYYLSELFHLIGFNLISSINIAIGLSFVLGFIFMFLFARAVWGKWAGFLGAVIFTLFPYRLGMVYIRGGFSEFLATSFIPLALFSFLRLGQTKKLIYFLLSSLSLALLFLSHSLQVLLFLPVLLIYLLVIFGKKIKKIILPTFFSGLLALGIASFFTLPAFIERKYLDLSLLLSGRYDFQGNFLKIKELILPVWDSYNYYQIGAVGIALLFLTFYLLMKKKKLDNFSQKNVYFFLILIILYATATLSVSAVFWELPLYRFIQFPWRTLSFLALGFGILGGILFKSEIIKIFFKKEFSQLTLVIIFSSVVVLANIIFIRPVGYLNIEKDKNYNPILQLLSETNIAEYSPLYDTIGVNVYSITPESLPKGIDIEVLIGEMQKILNEKLVSAEIEISKINILEGIVRYNIIAMDSYNYNIEFQAEEKSLVRFNNIWFPGWQAYLDDEEIKIDHDNDLQAMLFTIPSGNHTLKIEFRDTPIRTVGRIISIVAITIWVILFMYFLQKSLLRKNEIRKSE